MTRVTLRCSECGYRCRRDLILDPGCRGVHETRAEAEAGLCPRGHGHLVREDGFWESVGKLAGLSVLVLSVWLGGKYVHQADFRFAGISACPVTEFRETPKPYRAVYPTAEGVWTYESGTWTLDPKTLSDLPK